MDFEKNTTLPSPSDERITWFECAYRISLPASYLDVLQFGNGGVPTLRIFDQGKRERLIERMLCLLNNPKVDQVNGWYDLSVVVSQLDTRLIDDENLVGMNVIPIAVLFGGDYICLDYRSSPESPSIAVWDHEASEDFLPVLDTVASSFALFESMLR